MTQFTGWYMVGNAVGLLVVGVLAASQASVDISGTVSFVAKDVYVQITGKITGTAEGDDITLSPLNYSAHTENGEPTKEELDTWKNKSLNFLNKNSIIKIEITIENLSDEREVRVKLEGNVGVEDNVNRVLKNGDSVYEKGTFVTIQPNNNKAVFTIEMNVYNTNYLVKQSPYEYKMTLQDENFVEENNTNQNCKITCNVNSEETLDEIFIAKMEESEILATDLVNEDSLIANKNVYKAYTEYDEVYAYLETGNLDLNSITVNSTLEMKIYLSSISSDYRITIQEEEIEFEEEMTNYIVLSFKYKVTENVTINIDGYLSFIF